MVKKKSSIKSYIICSLILILNLLDAIITNYSVAYLGAEEYAPIARLLINMGFIYFYIFKVTIGVLVFFIFIKYWDKFKVAEYGGYLVVIIYFCLIIYHLINIGVYCG